MKIFICGPNATGKTSTSKILAKKLNFSFYDPDDIYLSRFGNDIGKLISEKKINVVLERISWSLRQIKEDNVVIPTNLFSSEETFNQKQKDADYCKTNGILILILPSEHIGESAQIIWNRIKEREYFNEKNHTFMNSFEGLKVSLKKLLEASDLLVVDSKSPEASANKIIELLHKNNNIQ
jgi:shikimate kinase